MPEAVSYEVLDAEAQSHYLTLVRFVSGNLTVAGGTVFICDPSGGDFTLTLPQASVYKGRMIVVKHVGSSGVVTVDGNGSETIDGDTTLLITQQWSAAHLVSDGANWVIV